MSGAGGGAHTTGPAERRAQGVLAEVRLAAGFLTIIPLLPRRGATDDAVARSLGWFPLVGFMLGAAICVEDIALGRIFGQVVKSVLVILSITAITGAVHLDGLADTADALGAGQDRGRALEILRDSRIGSFGTAAIFFALTLEILALATIAGTRRYQALYAAVGLARWAMVAVAAGLDYLRAEGAGSVLLGSDGSRNLAIASVVAAGAIAPIFSWRIAGAAIATIVIVAVMRWFYRRWLGGVTGDLVGACGQIVEVAVLIAMSR